MKITSTKIKNNARQISSMMHELRKKFFELEILQSVWEARTNKAKKYISAQALITDITKGL